MVTASHNPADYNGMKLVREAAKPISGDTRPRRNPARAEQLEGRARTVGDAQAPRFGPGAPILAGYVDHLLGYVDVRSPEAAQARRECGQRRRRAGHRRARARASRFDFDQDPARARRHASPTACPTRCCPKTGRLTSEAIRSSRRGFRHGLGRGLRPLLPLRRTRRVHRGLLHRGPAGRGHAGCASGQPDHPRPAPDLEHDRTSWQRAAGVAVQSKTGHAFIKERMRPRTPSTAAR